MTYEHDRALMEGARNSACDDYFSARPQIDNTDRRRVYEAGFQAGAASRDAEVQHLQFALADTEALEIAAGEKIDQLRAELVKALAACKEKDATIRRAANHLDSYGAKAQADSVREALITTPEQSLAEYRNKVIEAFVNEFSRHVGGDGEFWLHELQDFAMKEQP